MNDPTTTPLKQAGIAYLPQGWDGTAQSGNGDWAVNKNTNGETHVRVPDGSDIAKGAKSDAAVTNPALDATEIALLKGLLKQLQGGGTGATPVALTSSSVTQADSLAVNSAAVDTPYTFDFSVNRIVFLKNDGPSDVYVAFGVATGTAKKTLTLKAGEAVTDDPFGGFTVMNAKLTAAGTATLRFKVVG